MGENDGIRFVGGNNPLEVKVDENRVYFSGITIPLEVWRDQSFALGLPADFYLDIAASAPNQSGVHRVNFWERQYEVTVNGPVRYNGNNYIGIESIAQNTK